MTALSGPVRRRAPLLPEGDGPAAGRVNTFRDRLNPLRGCHVSGLLVVLSMQMLR